MSYFYTLSYFLRVRENLLVVLNLLIKDMDEVNINLMVFCFLDVFLTSLSIMNFFQILLLNKFLDENDVYLLIQKERFCLLIIVELLPMPIYH